MTVFFYIILLFTLSCFIGCDRNHDNEKFNGDISFIQDTATIERIAGTPVRLDALYTGRAISVLDSILICWTPKDPEASFHIYNLKNGESYGKFCRKGRGPNETVATAPIFQIYKDNGAMKALVNFHNERKIMHWNITASIEQNKSVFEGTTPRFDKSLIYKEIFWLNPDEIICYVESTPLTLVHDSATLPYIIKCSAKTGQPIMTYDLFKGVLEWSQKREQPPLPANYYNSMNCINPSRSKIVLGMTMLAQINIIDIGNGHQTGYRLEGTPGFDIFRKNLDNANVYFTQIQADDSYIYATFSDKSYKLGWEAQDLLYVFNWDGILVRKVRLDHAAKYIAIAEPGILYILDNNEETIYKYNLIN